MIDRRCPDPLPWETLVDYWLGELPMAGEDAAEEHLFSCESCVGALARLAALDMGLRAWFGGVIAQPVVTRATLEGLIETGLRVQEARLARGERVRVPIPGDVGLMVARLAADLSGVHRVDVEICAPDGHPFYVVPDVPFEETSGEVLVVCQRHVAIANPELLFRLLTFDTEGNRTAGDYSLVSVIA